MARGRGPAFGVRELRQEVAGGGTPVKREASLAPCETLPLRVRGPPAELHLVGAALDADVWVLRPSRGIPVSCSAVRSARKETEHMVRRVVVLGVAEELPFGAVVVQPSTTTSGVSEPVPQRSLAS